MKMVTAAAAPATDRVRAGRSRGQDPGPCAVTGAARRRESAGQLGRPSQELGLFGTPGWRARLEAALIEVRGIRVVP
jgi:hypothetical protein